MNAYVGETGSRFGGCARCAQRRAWQLRELDMHLCSTGAGHRDTHDVMARVSRFGLDGRIVIGRPDGMVLRARCGVLVLVHSRTVVMIRMIVAEVLVDVDRRRHRGGKDQSLNEQAGGEATHPGSLLRRYVSNWEAALPAV